MRDTKAYDLFKIVVEFEAYGVTVAPPQALRCGPGFIDHRHAGIIRICEARSGIRFSDYEGESPPAAKLTRNSWDLLEEA